MFLTEEQAYILLHDRSNVTLPRDIKISINQLKQYSIGQVSIILDTGTKLFYDKFRGAFYLNGNHPDNCDVLSLYDHLDILHDYYSWFLGNTHINLVHPLTKEELERKKSAYKQYKLSRLKQET